VDWETEFCRECAVRMEEYQPRCSHCEDEGFPEDPCDICGAGHEEESESTKCWCGLPAEPCEEWLQTGACRNAPEAS
jgi:hypothetical protein